MRLSMKVLKVLGAIVGILVVCIGGAVVWLSLRSPRSRAPSSEKVESTPQRVERGDYLVHHVVDCLGCHSDHVDKFGWPVKPGTEGQGGYPFDEKLGIPGTVCAQNL